VTSREWWLDALISKVAAALAAEATYDVVGRPLASRNQLLLEVIGSHGRGTRAEWEADEAEWELKRIAHNLSVYARHAFSTVHGTLGAAVPKDPPPEKVGLMICVTRPTGSHPSQSRQGRPRLFPGARSGALTRRSRPPRAEAPTTSPAPARSTSGPC